MEACAPRKQTEQKMKMSENMFSQRTRGQTRASHRELLLPGTEAQNNIEVAESHGISLDFPTQADNPDWQKQAFAVDSSNKEKRIRNTDQQTSPRSLKKTY